MRKASVLDGLGILLLSQYGWVRHVERRCGIWFRVRDGTLGGFTCYIRRPGVAADAAAEGLLVRLRGTLSKYPGCIHWHLAAPGERGTLEVTWWPAGNRLWLAVQAGRRAPWIAAALQRLKDRLESEVGRM